MNLKIILIGNYRPDKQYSMQIFEELIAEGYIKANLSINIIRPREFFGKLSVNNSSLFKWLGYVDKFLIFPMQLLVLRLKILFFLKKHTTIFVIIPMLFIFTFYQKRSH